MITAYDEIFEPSFSRDPAPVDETMQGALISYVQTSNKVIDFQRREMASLNAAIYQRDREIRMLQARIQLLNQNPHQKGD